MTRPTGPPQGAPPAAGCGRGANGRGVPGQRAVEWLRALGESLQVPEKSKEKADLMHAIHDRITVAGPEIVGCPADAGGLRARIGAGAARKG